MTQRDDDHDGPSAIPHQHGVDCRSLAHVLGEYVDDQLPTEMKSQVDAHMSQCAPCLAFLKQYRFAQDAARKVLLNSVPAELETRVLSFLRARCKKD